MWHQARFSPSVHCVGGCRGANPELQESLPPSIGEPLDPSMQDRERGKEERHTEIERQRERQRTSFVQELRVKYLRFHVLEMATPILV